MAIDTAAKRLSVINLGNPWRGLWPVPDATLDQGDRQTVLFLYSGILADVEVVDTSFTAERIYALTGADNRSHRLFGATLTHRLTGADTRNKELKG